MCNYPAPCPNPPGQMMRRPKKQKPLKEMSVQELFREANKATKEMKVSLQKLEKDVQRLMSLMKEKGHSFDTSALETLTRKRGARP